MRMKPGVFLVVASLLVWGGFERSARAAGVVADLSHHLIAITTAFSGTDVLVFGAVEEPGTDVAVVVRGPSVPTTVRRKTRVGPVWLNTDGLEFDDAPSYYAVAASRPLDEIVDVLDLRRHEIGVENIILESSSATGRDEAEIRTFAEALIRNQQRANLYSEEVSQIRFIGPKLFRTTLSFPANVPPGNYEVRVFEIRDSAIVGAQHNLLVVSKVGMEADIYDAAHRSPALYGLASILLAVCAGWTASAVFKK